jgi:hypothetical protein
MIGFIEALTSQQQMKIQQRAVYLGDLIAFHGR